jgi:hypothetical protein
VLLTSGAATGIAAIDAVHFAVEDRDAGFASRALQLLADRQGAGAMGAAARRFVVETMSWPAMLAPLPRIVGRAAAREGCRDAA